MAQAYAKGFYNSKAWKDTQRAYMEANNYICERCGSPAVVVHHKRHISPKNINDYNIVLNWDNLQALCTDCHALAHATQSPTQPDLMFDDKGNLVKVQQSGL